MLLVLIEPATSLLVDVFLLVPPAMSSRVFSLGLLNFWISVVIVASVYRAAPVLLLLKFLATGDFSESFVTVDYG